MSRADGTGQAAAQQTSADERYFLASGWQLMWRKFRRHHLALLGGGMLALLSLFGVFAEFFTPYSVERRFVGAISHRPSRIHFVDDSGRFHLRPFVYGITSTRGQRNAGLGVRGGPGCALPRSLFRSWRELPLVRAARSRHPSVRGGATRRAVLFGTDTIGRDVYSRTIYAARVSLFIGLAGVALTFVIGVTLGGISGYFGGRADMLIQRLIEFLMSLPTIPLWLALSAAMPRDWPIVRIYFGIVIVLSLVSWGRLARVVRGKLLELRELDFVMAARLSGMKESRIIRGHLLPNFAGYLIVSVSLDIPNMILAETALSFLGLGLRSPAVSWGVLLQDAQKLRSVAAFPWLIIPALFVVVAVLAFNFLGDGLRDAADPYK